MKYLLIILLVWVAPALIMLLAALWFLVIKGRRLNRATTDGHTGSGELPSRDKS